MAEDTRVCLTPRGEAAPESQGEQERKERKGEETETKCDDAEKTKMDYWRDSFEKVRGKEGPRVQRKDSP